MRSTRTHISQVFGLYLDPEGASEKALGLGDSMPPLLDGTTADGCRHSLWAVTDPQAIARVAAVLRDKQILIADGHHRYETTLAFHERDGSEESAWLMVVIVPTDQEGLTIFPTHRIVQHLGETGGTPIDAPGDALAVYRGGRYEEIDADGLDPEVVESFSPEGVTYTAYIDEAVDAVDRGDAEAAFILRPTKIDEVWEVARRGEVMPQKSTFFYPKLTSGLLLFPL